MQNKNKKLSFRLSEELRAKLLSYSLDKQISVSRLIEEALLEHFSKIEEINVPTIDDDMPTEFSNEITEFPIRKFWLWFITIGAISALLTFIARLSKKRGF
ncbi:MAG TPA: hypothetical protein VK175_05475 [Leadbetterella sp.]|nr:hypothetical protein [Leadbetterella sp.]